MQLCAIYMVPSNELRTICDALNHYCTGGQIELSKRLGRSAHTMRRKLAGDPLITRVDELEAKYLLERKARSITEN